MKNWKNILLIIVAMGLTLSLNAQEEPSWKETLPRHDFQFGIGDPALLSYGVGDVLLYNLNCNSAHCGYGYYFGGDADSWFYNDVVNTLTFATPTLNFEYRYRFAKWFWFGGAVSYTGIFKQYKDRITKETLARTGMHYVSIMPSVRFSWLNTKYITLYSGLSLGCTIAFGREYWPDIPNNDIEYDLFSGVGFCGQLTAVGIQGGKNWYGFAEVGFGHQGFVKAGFGYKFNKKKSE